MPAASTNSSVMVVSPKPKVDGRTAVPVMSFVTVVLRCRGGNIQSNTASSCGNLSGNRINLIEQSITGTDLSDTLF